jgi:hypothetical protein
MTSAWFAAAAAAAGLHNPSVRHHCPQIVIRWLDENNKKNNRPITFEGVERVRLRNLTSHYLTPPIRLGSVAPPLVANMVIIDPKAIVADTEDIAKTEG